MTVALWTATDAVCTSVHDGDTMHFDATFHLSDLPTDVAVELLLRFRAKRCRVLGIDAPELKVKGQPNGDGLAARDHAAALLVPGTPVTIAFSTRDDHGRPLVTVTLPDGRDFGQTMIADGFAVVWP